MSGSEGLRDDALLAALWAEDEPAAGDPAFVIAAMQRLERRRLMVNVIWLAPWAAAGAAALWALEPHLQELASAFGPVLQPLNVAAVAAGLASAWLLTRPDAAAHAAV